MRIIPPPLRLPLIFVLAVLLRLGLASLVTEPTVMGDELSYKAMAEKFFRTGDFYAPGHIGVSMGFSNLLYMLVISPAFYFEDFFGAIKIINALLISLTVFPVYALTREFREEPVALAVAGLSALMPFNTISVFIMAENLYVPLFWSALYFFFRGLLRAAHKDAAAMQTLQACGAGVFLGLLFLTKPQAISLALTFVFIAGGALVFARRLGYSVRGVLTVAVATALVAYLVQAVGNFLLHGGGDGSGVVGSHYTQAMERPTVGDLFTKSFLGMSGGHLAYLLILFALPVFHLAYQGIRAYTAPEDPEARKRMLFAIAAIGTFGAAFAMALIFTQTISHIEHNLRLHARYYSFIFPIFLISTAVLPPELPRFRGARIVLAGLLLLVAVGTIVTYRTYPSNAFGVDYTDWAWLNLRFVDKSRFYMLGVPVMLLGAFACLQAVRRLSVPHWPLFVFYTCFAILGTYGQTWNTTTSIRFFHSGFSEEREYIRETIGDFSQKVGLAEHGFVRRCNYVFWLPYEYANILDRPYGTPIEPGQFPPGTEWVILIGEHQPGFPFKQVHERPNLKIYEL